MKFILFNINDTNKNIVNKIYLDSNHYINEISLSKTKLEEIQKESPNFLQRIKNKYLDKDINKKIVKALDRYNKKWYYVFSNQIKNNKYIMNKVEAFLGYKLNYTNELDTNIFKYVDEYLSKNNSLKKHELKVLLVATSNNSLNFTLLNNLIKEYKSVNIYLKEKPSAYILKRIKQINKAEGTTIEILKKERKQFAEYKVIYFIDDIKENYPRFRLNKDALVIDINLSASDKFNSNVIFMNEFMLEDSTNKNNIQELLKTYNSLELARVIRKIVNELDKI